MKAIFFSLCCCLLAGCAHTTGDTSRMSAVIVVAPDGTGSFRTVQEAFDAVPDHGDRWTLIRIRPGRYREKLFLKAGKEKVIIRADEEGTALLTYDDHTGKVVGRDTINTRTSASCSLEADDVVIEGITFENSAGRVGQAVALQVTGDRVALTRCRLHGDQDTFFARGIGRIFLRECEIEGTTDFIFGSSIVLFERCRIRSKKDSYVTAASTPEGNRFGFVFESCTLVADDSIARVYLGRPWRPFARTVFLRCALGSHILPAGWHNWSKPDAERTAFYAEYRCRGEGAGRVHRVPWSRELTESEAGEYTAKEIFSSRASAAGFAGDWVPPVPPGTTASDGNVWVPDNGDGTFTNPVLYADYSDPDVIRVGGDFYLTASSFNCAPGLPILHSKDLVNWRLIGHALQAVPPVDSFRVPRHGMGVWAPALRFRNGEFRIYYGDPDFGIFMVKARHPEGPWDTPILIRKAKGWIDPCPFWDADGSAYIVHAWAKSRAGFNSILTINRMNPEGSAIVDDGVTVFDGTGRQPTIEGPKMYARDGYYYIFAPAGGVRAGWQAVLRSRELYGPYEARIVMDQGSTGVNGPHQGSWIELNSGESWFMHFQQKGAYGRVVHLQPLRWEGGWPVIGIDAAQKGKGEPVTRHRKPAVMAPDSIQVPQSSDEFSDGTPGPQWQWSANASGGWILPAGEGVLRLAAVPLPPGSRTVRDAPNLLLQKLSAPRFSALVQLTPNLTDREARGGLVIMGPRYATLSVRNRGARLSLVQTVCAAAGGGEEIQNEIVDVPHGRLILKVDVADSALCSFAYSTDGTAFHRIGALFRAEGEAWIGAKVGLFCVLPADHQAGRVDYMDIDWFRIEPLR